MKEILGFAREVRMHRKLVDLNDIVIGILDLLESEFDVVGNEMRKEISSEPIMLMVDPDRAREAIMNIAVNANQATTNGIISFRTYIKGSHGVYEVEDTGAGIDDEDISRVFDPFYTTRDEGTGLGLAVSKRIIEENEGWIEIERKPSFEGTVFKVFLPLEED